MSDETRERRRVLPASPEAEALGKALRALIRGAAPDRQMSAWWALHGLSVATRRAVERGVRVPSARTLGRIVAVAGASGAAVEEVWGLWRAAATAWRAAWRAEYGDLPV